jgi:hypothetical protein
VVPFALEFGNKIGELVSIEVGILQESAVGHDPECSVDQSPARQRIEEGTRTSNLFVIVGNDRSKIGNPESKRLVVGGPRVGDFLLPVVVVFDLKDTFRLVACPVGRSFKRRRLQCVEGGAGKDLTAIIHTTHH